MVNVSSLPVVGGSSFDLDSQAGVTHLLASVRVSEISSEHKNEVRDLVFLYTNGGKDVTVRRALEQKIDAYSIAPVTPKVAVVPLPPPPVIGTYRMSPAFTPPIYTASQTPTPKPSIEPAPIMPPALVVPPPSIETKVTINTSPKPVVVETPPSPEVAVLEVRAAEPVMAPAPVSDDNQVHLNRIREIKATVNEKVGNPVNLVDIDNVVGREYMSALLDAMKKLNSGSGAAPAMRRLEEAFVAVQTTLEKHEHGMDVPQPEPISVPEEVREPVLNRASLSGLSIPEPIKAESETLPNQEVEPESNYVLEEKSPVQAAWQAPVAVTPAIVDVPPAQSGWNAVPTKTMPVTLVHSLAESEPAKTLESLPLVRKTEVLSSVGDILHTSEVNEGLEQLLLEWSLFKKSGLFGTGPKGHEHPLFKKIAELQIPLLLAGRFEGATQEIKQSITDYMNGWRYEQGIIYEPGELFEHYLRRVIRHILDLQKTKIS